MLRAGEAQHPHTFASIWTSQRSTAGFCCLISLANSTRPSQSARMLRLRDSSTTAASLRISDQSPSMSRMKWRPTVTRGRPNPRRKAHRAVFRHRRTLSCNARSDQ